MQNIASCNTTQIFLGGIMLIITLVMDFSLQTQMMCVGHYET